jgi:hypothetical protein
VALKYIEAMSLDATTVKDLEAWRDTHCLRIVGKEAALYMSKEKPLRMQEPVSPDLASSYSSAMLKLTVVGTRTCANR